jgi:hypothetical protein
MHRGHTMQHAQCSLGGIDGDKTLNKKRVATSDSLFIVGSPVAVVYTFVECMSPRSDPAFQDEAIESYAALGER